MPDGSTVLLTEQSPYLIVFGLDPTAAFVNVIT